MQYVNLVEVSLPSLYVPQILELAAQNVADLVKEPIQSDHPLIDRRRALLLSEIECYLKILPTGQYFQQGRISPGLVLAIDNDDTVVGCVLYARGDVDNACGLIYAVVSREYRRNGIMRGMITKLRETITNIGLSCTIETVPIYEKLGFAVRDAKGPQIAMDTGGPTRPMGLYDTPFYSQNRRVRETESQLKNALGKRFEVLLHNLDHDARCGAEKARNFVAKYKA